MVLAQSWEKKINMVSRRLRRRNESIGGKIMAGCGGGWGGGWGGGGGGGGDFKESKNNLPWGGTRGGLSHQRKEELSFFLRNRQWSRGKIVIGSSEGASKKSYPLSQATY